MTNVEFNFQLTSLQQQLEYFARKLTNNDDDAMDLLQETYLKALVYRDKFVDKTNLKAWLFTIMKNIFINNYRRNMRSRTIIDTTDNLYHINSSDNISEVMPDSEIYEKEIQEEINALSDEQRIPFEMHTQGFKYKEIAEELDISIGTVKSRIFFTRKRLMENLQDFEN
jgi:RNA polymerase sigma-70 factor, ECF subfamily